MMSILVNTSNSVRVDRIGEFFELFEKYSLLVTMAGRVANPKKQPLY